MFTRPQPERPHPLPASRCILSSRSNPTVKRIRTLRERKARERTGLAFVEGIRIVTEALDLGASVEALVVAPDLLSSEHAWRLLDSQRCRDLPLIELSPDAFCSVATRQHPEGLGALVRPRWTPLGALAPSTGIGAAGASSPAAADRRRAAGAHLSGGRQGTLGFVALHEVQYAGNLGTIIRTADAFGAAVALSPGCADPTSPKALRASTGSIWRVPVRPFEASDTRLRGTRVALTSHGGTPLGDVDLTGDVVFLLGAEREGLPDEVERDEDAWIPIAGAESLNVAAAGAIALYEWRRQNRD